MAELIAKPELIEQVKLEGFATASVGMYTLGDIREELRKPGRDPREKFVAAKWRDDVQEIADLKPGMTLEGVVTNVTRFGAFVDIGVHQDGLVHTNSLCSFAMKGPPTECPFIGGEACLSSRRIVLILMA